jgi:hypothetical protein
MRSIYRKLAKKHGISVAEVKREMQIAIDYAYQDINQSVGEKTKQKSLPCKGDTPTPEEFIRYAAKEMRDKQRSS